MSPFWRGRTANDKDAPPRPESTKVVGASYSHADMLKMDSLSIGGGSHSKTPPTQSRDRSPDTKSSPLTKTRSNNAATPRKNYHRFLSDSSKSWAAAGHTEREDDELDNDEDEFGLPSITTTRSRTSRKNNGSITESTLPSSSIPTTAFGQLSRNPALDSGDIAEERGLPNYPTAKPSQGKILRPQYKDILKDPANSLHLINHPTLPPNASAKESQDHSARITRINKFKRILQASAINLSDLRETAWSGVPEEVRAMSWQILLGYLPTGSERRVATLERKRREYLDGIRQAFERTTPISDKSGAPNAPGASMGYKGRGRGLDEAIWHQISIDVPRTNPHLPLYAYEATQRSLERILYLWAIRHPASGYVQGINDLVTPFWQVFLGSYITDSDVEFGMDPGQLPKAVLDAVEADSFWCVTKLLDGIQDNYVHAQPGIQRQVASLRDLTKRIDVGLVSHMEHEGVEFMQFSFRWMNCLLMREVSVKNVIRMWDTYLAEEQGFSEFHVYVCAAFLVKWSEQLVKMDFQEILVFLQALPTRDWTVKDIEMLLSEAFIWQSLFRGSSAHLRDSDSRTASIG